MANLLHGHGGLAVCLVLCLSMVSATQTQHLSTIRRQQRARCNETSSQCGPADSDLSVTVNFDKSGVSVSKKLSGEDDKKAEGGDHHTEKKQQQGSEKSEMQKTAESLFKRFDADANQELNSTEFNGMAEIAQIQAEEAAELLAQFDSDKNKQLNLNEAIDMMKAIREKKVLIKGPKYNATKKVENHDNSASATKAIPSDVAEMAKAEAAIPSHHSHRSAAAKAEEGVDCSSNPHGRGCPDPPIVTDAQDTTAKMAVSHAEAISLFKRFDYDDDNTLNREELTTLVEATQDASEEPVMLKAFPASEKLAFAPFFKALNLFYSGSTQVGDLKF
eukprot:jgi/Bigna1/76549/fgenesh1_pg.42_\